MRIYINKATGDAIPGINAEGATATAESPLRVRGGSVIPVELQFVDLVDGVKTPVRYPVDTSIQWVLKRVGKFTGDIVLAIPSDFIRPSADDGYYTASLNTTGDDVLGALNDLDDNPDNDADSVTLAGEITILAPAAEAPDRTQHIHVVIENYYSHAGEFATAPSLVFDYPGDTRALLITDSGKYIRATGASGLVVTVPPQSDVEWTNFAEITIEQAGAAAVSIAAGAGVTINSACDLTSLGQFGIMRLKRVAEDVWTLTACLSIADQDATPPGSTPSSLVSGADFFGISESPFLGSPSKWLSVNIGGTVYKIPAFT